MNALSEPAFYAPAPHMSTEPESFELLRYWRAINRHRVGIILFVIAVGIIASLYASSLRSVFRGTATVLLDPVRKKSVTNQELMEEYSGTSRDYYLTQIEIMKSREYAERLVRVLNLTTHPEYDPRQRKPVEKGIVVTVVDALSSPVQSVLGAIQALRPAPPPGPAVTATAQEDDIRDAVVARVMSQLSFQAVRNTQLLKVSFDSNDPRLAERIPNTLSMIYIVADLEARTQSSRQSTSFLAEQADDLKKKLAESERELQQYRESQKIVIAKGLSQSEATRRLDESTTALEDARRKRTEAEFAYKQVLGQPQQSPEALPVVQRNQDVERRHVGPVIHTAYQNNLQTRFVLANQALLAGSDRNGSGLESSRRALGYLKSMAKSWLRR